MPEEARAKALFADPAGPAARRFFGLPEDPKARIAAQVDFVWAQACTGKFVWPIPDKGLKKHIHRIAAPTLIVWGKADGIDRAGLCAGIRRPHRRLPGRAHRPRRPSAASRASRDRGRDSCAAFSAVERRRIRRTSRNDKARKARNPGAGRRNHGDLNSDSRRRASSVCRPVDQLQRDRPRDLHPWLGVRHLRSHHHAARHADPHQGMGDHAGDDRHRHDGVPLARARRHLHLPGARRFLRPQADADLDHPGLCFVHRLHRLLRRPDIAAGLQLVHADRAGR